MRSRSVCRSARAGRTVYARVACESTVDSEKCQGHNRCYALAPELFDVDDYGKAVVIGDGSVPPELEEKARLAVANCPEYAITHRRVTRTTRR